MKSIHRTSAALGFAMVWVPLSFAHAAGCTATQEATPLTLGTVAPVGPEGARTFTLQLNADQGVIVDLFDTTPKASGDEDSEDGNDAAVPHDLKLCDAKGSVIAPQPGEVFAKGGSLTATEDGQRLRFHATEAGEYTISVAKSDAPREILVRAREVGTGPAPIVSATLGEPQKGTASSKAPMVFSFAGAAGQWVQLKSNSEKDTLLRLAAPDNAGNYRIIAENDDSDGLNPMIRRKLPATGTYFIQVDSLADEAGEFDLTLEKISAPKPPPPPTALRLGGTTSGKLADGEAVAMYALPVMAGHSYRLELITPYDGVVGIGVGSPVEPDDGGTTPDASFTEIKSADANTSGTEKLTFTARNNGQVLVRLKSFGIGESDGGYTLTATDLGG